MKKKSVLITIAFVICLLVIVSCGPAATPEPTMTPTPAAHKGKALVESRCNTCHPLGLVENSKFSEGGWKIVVDRMVVAGAPLDVEQQALVVDYLAQTYPLDQ
jgi:hypothetical protein